MNPKSLLKVVSLAAFILLLTACAVPTPAAPTPAAPESATKAPPTGLENGIQQIGGIVLGGGDTTPAGLMDAPRTFAYQIKADSGEEITVTYTAYPPSPAGDAKPEVKLSFHAGEILVGDYLVARGTFDKSSQTLTVGDQGDFIETYAEKP
ncbi:MAG TPA: hypothetical protein VN364_09435 [Bellilinea sp.]|nr:hypothetical protein [Bellilinea sp.]